MKKSAAKQWVFHLLGVFGCSLAAFLIWLTATAVAMRPIINRTDDLSRNENGFSTVERICGNVSDGMGYPFSSLPAHGILDGPQSFLIMALFWGSLLYLVGRALVRFSLRRVRPTLKASDF